MDVLTEWVKSSKICLKAQWKLLAPIENIVAEFNEAVPLVATQDEDLPEPCFMYSKC